MPIFRIKVTLEQDNAVGEINLLKNCYVVFDELTAKQIYKATTRVVHRLQLKRIGEENAKAISKGSL